MYVGSSTKSMYHPQLLQVCAMAKAQKGVEVMMAFQGTGSFYKLKL